MGCYVMQRVKHYFKKETSKPNQNVKVDKIPEYRVALQAFVALPNR